MTNPDEIRDRILASAEKLFSRQGYDKATVDAIAAEAEVNKAVIYHHFDGKADIVQTIFDRVIDEAKRLHPSDLNPNERVLEGIAKAVPFTPGLRIMLMEALKTSCCNDSLIEFGLAVIEREHPELMELPPEQRKDAFLGEFFTIIVPFIAYCALKEHWCRSTGMDIQAADDAFAAAITKNLPADIGK